MKKKELELKLQEFEGFDQPKADLEQYMTPPELASSVLWSIYLRGEIQDKRIYDLGCGVGTLGIGAKLLGADEVVCIDVDEEAVRVAKENAKKTGVDIEFRCSDIREVSGSADLVIQNPPFGSQKRGSDRPFIEKSLEIASVVYSFHMTETEGFVEEYVEEHGADIALKEELSFPLKRTMPWHEKDVETIEVTLYRFERA